ncbi:hypothetical protein LUZ63_000641 [Rhynchospora breviuscula]|uniref:Late embryogenesis abundant protein LEA-2 subgroup domain-containing protein n=1 Tax=Rhynchospora breviuscula TaxID=2022672 RepID=A0A9Q0CVE3_9POAL|nr:hypothetical protein LUZ63_000641 [Rhynchospora breviuscula]
MQSQQKTEEPLATQSPLPLYASTTTSEPNPKRRPKKCFKITCCVLISITIVLIAILLFFGLFLFKKRNVEVISNSATLNNVSYSLNPITLNLVMTLNLGIRNPNYAGFDYQETNTTIFYHGTEAGISTMPAGGVKARSSKTIYNTVNMNGTAIMSSPYLLPELTSGKLPISTNTTMVGKIILFNTIKIHATVQTTCDITIMLQSQTSDANCKGNVKMS